MFGADAGMFFNEKKNKGAVNLNYWDCSYFDDSENI